MAIHTYLTAGEQLVAHCDFLGHWTWEEFREASRRLKRCLLANPEPTAIILNLSQSAPLPPGGIPHIAHLIKHCPDHIHQVIIITQSEYIRFILKTYVAKRLPTNTTLHVVPTAEAAQHLVMAPKAAI